MRVGLLAPPREEDAGGGDTCGTMVLAAAARFAFRADIVVLDVRAIDDLSKADLADEDGKRPAPAANVRVARALNHHVERHRLDLLWLVTPSTIAAPDVPFVVTVWDPAQRFHPCVPGVSRSGCTGQEREDDDRTVLRRASYVLTGTQRDADEIGACYGIPRERIRIVPLPTPRIGAAPQRIDRYLAAVDAVFAEFAGYRSCWATDPAEPA